MTRVVLYARVSTSDKDQDVLTQLLPLREFAQSQGWEVVSEYVDHASARDLAHRTGWRQLLDDAAKRRFKAVVVVRLDRAFRSVKDMHDTLATWDALGIAFRSMREGFDTATAVGRLLLNLLAAVAEFELELIRERIKEGMDRARRQGRRIGRPRVTEKRGFSDRFVAVMERLDAGNISRRQAARELGVGYATLKRLIDGREPGGTGA